MPGVLTLSPQDRSSRTSTASIRSSAQAAWASSSRRRTSSSISASRSSCLRDAQRDEATSHASCARRARRASSRASTSRACSTSDALDDDAPYIVMELLEGDDLATLVKRAGRSRSTRPSTTSSQACEALAEAHARGIVHRDLKPANLFLTRAPRRRAVVKVLDFGVSKMLDASDGTSRRRGDAHERGRRARIARLHGARADASSRDVDARARHLFARRDPLPPRERTESVQGRVARVRARLDGDRSAARR